MKDYSLTMYLTMFFWLGYGAGSEPTVSDPDCGGKARFLRDRPAPGSAIDVLRTSWTRPGVLAPLSSRAMPGRISVNRSAKPYLAVRVAEGEKPIRIMRQVFDLLSDDAN